MKDVRDGLIFDGYDLIMYSLMNKVHNREIVNKCMAET